MHMPVVSLSLLQEMKDWPSMMKGTFIAGAGLLGVFLVLVLFYVSVRLLERLLRDRAETAAATEDGGGTADDES